MTVRDKLVELMDATVRNARQWHYALFRPCGASVTYWQATRGIVWSDCSAGGAILYRLVGAPNPLHAGGYDGYGNTATAFAHLPHITLAEAQVGDAVIYGPGGSNHIAFVREAGPDPLLWSNGNESAPEFVRFSTERTWQPSPETWVRCLPPDPAPSPPAPVRDGYWVWLRWYLGEGEFKGHKRVPELRPNVPARIPGAWWNRERTFVANRRRWRS